MSAASFDAAASCDPDSLRGLVAAAARLLPAQGPISSFVALNPLHGFEDRPFEQAVEEAARVMHAQPYLEESVYREALVQGRIQPADIDVVLADELGPRAVEPLAGGRVRLIDVQRVLLTKGLKHESDTAVRWTLTESDATERLRPDLDSTCRARLLAAAGDGQAGGPNADRTAASDLWHACVEATAGGRAAVMHRRLPARPRDLIVAVRPDLDPDAVVHPPLIRLVSAYLDQGVADWGMADRSRGLLAAVAGVASRFGPEERWARGLRARFAEIAARCRAAAEPGDPADVGDVACEVIAEELDTLAIAARDRAEVVASSLLSLRGWAGMVWQLEQRPDLAPCVRLPARLADFLAVRLVFDRVAAAWTAARLVGAAADTTAEPLRLAAVWTELRDRFPATRGPGTVSRAFLLHQLAQLLGLTAGDLRSLDDHEIGALERSIYAFDSFTRRRLLHLAYERRFNTTIFDALSAVPPESAPPRRRAQVVFCIDDRCESLRRHLEETDPAVETFGAAGFFAVPMNYRGLDDWHATPLCPIVVRPGHTVTEEPEADHLSHHRARQRSRRLVGRIRERLFAGSRTLFIGGLLTSVGGAIAAVPLVSRVVFPRLTMLLAARLSGWGRRRIRTRLELFRTAAAPLPDGTLPGFTAAEMAGIVRRLLEDIGLTGSFARLVVLLGHGSTSLNNPHESAYDCGACGGGRGGPNARAFAIMANDPGVRALLAADGLVIPADTVFVGGMQDTCSSGIGWFDTDRLPATHRDEFQALLRSCAAARGLDAQERCRRFDSVPPGIAPADALRAVEARAGDLAQVRPEYGHATTAVCVVGRRRRTRNLFLDRRAFLMSYDPDSDPDDTILSRTLAAVGPVCSGISLAYTFSRIDPLVYGAGTKLPHNITGLIGVMDGHASDLRTGLPLQGVEIHEPVRLLLVVETTPDRLWRALVPLPGVERLVRNGWVTVACWPPQGRMPEVYDRRLDRFVPHVVESSLLPEVVRSGDWYAGVRGNLPPALIRPGRSPQEEAA